MDISIISGPVIGALIGYFTNYIAIKMMFRPFNEKKIGNMKVPFTPGIIPKRKDSMAKAIGIAVGENLLSKETIKQALLSEDVKKSIKAKIEKEMNNHREDSTTIEEIILSYADEKDYLEDIISIEDKLTIKLKNKLIAMEIGSIISEKVVEIAKEKMDGNFILSKFSNKIGDSIKNPVKVAVDTYFEEDGESIIKPAVTEGIKSVSQTTVSKVISKVEKSNIDITDIVLKIYESIINDRLETFLKEFKISEIIENKIKEMNMEEVEKLTFKTIKKELNAIVNLGAVIGFILGLINVLF